MAGDPPASSKDQSDDLEATVPPLSLEQDDDDDDEAYTDDDMDDNMQVVACLPTEAETVLLCLDYLRKLRRAFPPTALHEQQGLSADYVTLACWALNRAFTADEQLLQANGNDAYFSAAAAAEASPHRKTTSVPSQQQQQQQPKQPPPLTFPSSLEEMEQELLYSENYRPRGSPSSTRSEASHHKPSSPYEYDDMHASNSHRFYALAGLASGPTLTASLTLPEIAAAGLAGLGARSRLDAERDMIQSPLFRQFLNAVQQKGFFVLADDDDDNNNNKAETSSENEQLYQQRYRKVVAKFRNKLATKADAEMVGDLVALSAAEQSRLRRAERIRKAWASEYATKNNKTLENGERLDDDEDDKSSALSSTMPPSYVNRNNLFTRLIFGDHSNADQPTVASPLASLNPVDLEEAEKLKTAGNSHMQRKEYQEAASCYTSALKLCPDGPNSHVYFSNRAAAWVSMKQFEQAIADSERSLALRPDYSKAHARLGLAHFLLGNYRQAMEAYTVALKYEPDNASSKNYLTKAAKKLAVAEYEEDNEVGVEASTTPAAKDRTAASFSVVSEWGKSSHHKNSQQVKEERKKINAEREAEKFKVKGNSYMAHRAYPKALEAYSMAISTCPNGAHSHVYYSNRAAALCYLERYAEAEQDSLTSLQLVPTYGKANARLGLSRFFLRNYQGAVDAYTAALLHDPDNAASKSYLIKAKAKLEATQNVWPVGS